MLRNRLFGVYFFGLIAFNSLRTYFFVSDSHVQLRFYLLAFCQKKVSNLFLCCTMLLFIYQFHLSTKYTELIVMISWSFRLLTFDLFALLLIFEQLLRLVYMKVLFICGMFLYQNVAKILVTLRPHVCLTIFIFNSSFKKITNRNCFCAQDQLWFVILERSELRVVS